MNKKYNIIFDKTGRVVKSVEDIKDQAVLLMSRYR